MNEEDLLKPNMHNLKDVLLLNSLHNIISEPTRQLALLDPIIVHKDMSTLSQGIIQVPNEIRDHCATYVHIPFEYLLHDTFTRNVWIIKMQIMNCSIKKYLILIGYVFIKVLSMKQVHYLQIFLLNLLNCAYLVKLL